MHRSLTCSILLLASACGSSSEGSSAADSDSTAPVISQVLWGGGPTSLSVEWATDEPASGTLRYGATEAYELGSVVAPDLAESQSVAIAGLESGTSYHVQIVATDGAANSTYGEDLILSTNALATGVPSDDFNAFNLDPARWELLDPLGDVRVRFSGQNTQDAAIEIEVPAGTEHTIYDVFTSPRISQSVPDGDFSVTVEFASLPGTAYQGQGLVFEQDEQSYLRFDLYSNGSNLQVFSAVILEGVPSVKINAALASPPARLWLRVTRSADLWLQEYSLDGTSWSNGATFVQPLALQSAGIFVANAAAGGEAPGFTAIVDSIQWSGDPIAVEDGGNAVDELPPLVYGVTTVRGHRSLQVVWATDEPATGQVQYGLTPALELGTIPTTGSAHEQELPLVDLEPGTTYHYRILAQDGGGRTTTSPTFSATTLGNADPEPQIELWYGMQQSFGSLGEPQQWVNVNGNAGAASYLEMSLGGGPFVPLSLGPNGRRLERAGDFVVEIDYADLEPGTTDLILRAHGSGATPLVSEEVVRISRAAGNTWPDSYGVDWSALSRIAEGAQVVDGQWALEGSSLRMVEPGYDRLVAIGDRIAWDDYEVTCTITMHGIDPVYAYPANPGPSVGFLLRWIGHQPTGAQPRQGYVPLGTIACYQWYQDGTERLELQDDVSTTADTSGKTLDFGVPYVFKARVETAGGGAATYSFKVWEEGASEPPAWDVVGTMAGDLQAGSLLLLLHYADASYGAVEVTPL